MDNVNKINLNNSPLTTDYLPRPRLDKIFDQATRGKLVYVIAGAGYGKTQAVRHYIEQQPDAVVRWVQLSESDNVGSCYWESLAYTIASDNPDLATRLRELGFPETSSRFKQFTEILKRMEYRAQKTFFVFDDFHLIHSKEALGFVERCARLDIPGACMIIISRTEPGINTVSSFSRGEASRVTEDELRFTVDEIAEFFTQNAVPFRVEDLSKFADVTKGWALAVKLLSLVLKRDPTQPGHAIDIMKQNTFKLFETEAWVNLPASVQKMIVEISLVSDLPLALLQEVLHDRPLLQDAPNLTSFVWFDSLTGDYRMHPLYLEFVQSKQDILSSAEKQSIYRQAAQWCLEHDFYMDAVNYFAKSRQFDRIIEVLFSYPFKLPTDACEYFLDILEQLDFNDEERSDPSVLFLENFFVPIFLIGAGRCEEARKRSLDAIQTWEHADSPLSSAFLGIAYSNLAYIDFYTCPVTHQYNAPDYLKKSIDYFKKSPIPPTSGSGSFAVADIRSFACLVGESATLVELDQFMEATKRTARYLEETFHDMYYGYDDLVACEIAFFKNQPDVARVAAHRAAEKAREKRQYSIEAMAEQYLLRIALQEGDYPLVKELLNQLREHLKNPDFWNRQLVHDLYVGFFYAQIELPEMIPAWFIVDEKETASEVRLPARELIVSVKYYIASKKYSQALTLLGKSTPRDPYERFLFGELALSLLSAVAKIKMGDTAGALTDFKKAYHLSFEGVFERPFVDLGRNLRPLVAAELKEPNRGIPIEWLKMIDRKASAYAKKVDVITDSVKRAENIEDTVQLSDRELDVLNDLYQGLSREEIAANRHLSVNTIKKALQSIYIKLDASNMADAIRIAMGKKLIEQ